MQSDIAIIGGGLVGAALARNLAANNMSALVIDNQPAEAAYNPELDNRGIALSYASIKFLDKIGIWKTLQPRAHAIQAVHISEQDRFGFTKLDCASVQLPALGYVISASDLGRALLHNLSQLVPVLRPVQITNFKYDPAAHWHLTTESQQINAKLLLAADGSNSQLRKYCDAINLVKNYDQTAIICNLTTKHKISAVAYERFCRQGVLALLPFGTNLLKCVFTVPNRDLPRFLALDDQSYIDVLQRIIGFRAGVFIGCSVRKTFPLLQITTPKVTAPGAIFVGNAANTLHPVAAQGLNLGLRDVVALTDILSKFYPMRDLTNPRLFELYNQSSLPDQQRTQQFTNSIVEIFGSDIALIAKTRSFGLIAAQFMPILRRSIISQGIGTWR